MKKYIIYIISLQCLLSIASAQTINTQTIDESRYHINTTYDLHFSKPIIRISNSTNIVVAYYENNYHGVFIVFDYNNPIASVDTFGLPYHHYVYDFEISGSKVYLCGEVVTSIKKSKAVIGMFDYNDILINGTTNLDLFTLETSRDKSKLNKMVAYNHPITGDLTIFAIGFGENYDEEQMTFIDEIDFVVEAVPASVYFNISTFNYERYYDVIETDKHVILAGTIINAPAINPIGFRKFEKVNTRSGIENDFYYEQLPEPEPLTYIIGENIPGTELFFTATFANINGYNGTIIRKYNALTMTMLHSQFVLASSNEKTEPYELKHMLGTDKILLLENSTDASMPNRIVYIDTNNQNTYSAIVDFYNPWGFYSIEQLTTEKYITIGYSTNNPVFLIKNIFHDLGCVIQKEFKVLISNNYSLTQVNVPLNFYNSFDYKTSINFQSQTESIIIDCIF